MRGLAGLSGPVQPVRAYPGLSGFVRVCPAVPSTEPLANRLQGRLRGQAAGQAAGASQQNPGPPRGRYRWRLPLGPCAWPVHGLYMALVTGSWPACLLAANGQHHFSAWIFLRFSARQLRGFSCGTAQKPSKTDHAMPSRNLQALRHKADRRA